jgi:hypothetical protein
MVAPLVFSMSSDNISLVFTDQAVTVNENFNIVFIGWRKDTENETSGMIAAFLMGLSAED